MNIPKFTAEAALTVAAGNYLTFRSTGQPGGRHSLILPQLPIGFCQANCDHIQDIFLRSVCELRCLDQSGGGGGGGGGGGRPVCRPSCGPCKPDSSSPTGRSRTCIKRNCDDFDRTC